MGTLRERHKAARRQEISDAATRLFEQRGFEAVTLAEIAAAADVSVKTIWNHFGSKEELFFDAEDAVGDLLVAAVRDRAPGTSAAAALAPLLTGPILAGPCRWSQLDDELYERIRVFSATERASSVLANRRWAIIRGWSAPLGVAAGSPAWAACFTGLLAERHQLVADGFLERRAPRTIQKRLTALLDPALTALEGAFPPRPAPARTSRCRSAAEAERRTPKRASLQGPAT